MMKRKTLLAAFFSLLCVGGFAQKFTFLHFSDAHGTTDARLHASELMKADSEIRFALDGGDMVESSKTEIHSGAWSELSGRFYATLGNHDVMQGCGRDEVAAKKYFLDGYIADDVVWGENGYYYKDFDADGKTVRLICLNCFECKKTGSTSSSVTMSGAQHEWLAEVLRSTPSDGYIMIALHAPVGDTNGTVNLNHPCSMTESLIANPFAQPFFLELFKPGADDYDLSLIPRIVDTYLRRGKLSGNFNTGKPDNRFTLDLDFSTANPAKFLCYLSGHMHFDLNDYLTSYPNQLVHSITITNDNRLRTVNKGILRDFVVNSDRTYSNPSLAHNIAIDRIDIDFGARSITISRIGRDSNIDNSRIVRKPCTFDFEKPVNIDDNQPYRESKDNVNTTATYTRNFTKDCWQALYLPFALNYEDWKDKADIARFASVTEAYDGDGLKAALHFETLTGGSTQPNTPYVIKPRRTGEITFTTANTTVFAAPAKSESVTFTCPSGGSYRLSGTYTPKGDMYESHCYALFDGQFLQASNASVPALSPFRIYLEVSPAPGSVSAPRLTINLADETTSIAAPTLTSPPIYSLSGLRLRHTPKGVSIVGGRKHLTR